MSHRTFDNPDSIDAKQGLLDNRCERNHPKRHRTRKRMAAVHKAKRNAGLLKQAKNAARARRYKSAVRAYWAGERDEHP